MIINIKIYRHDNDTPVSICISDCEGFTTAHSLKDSQDMYTYTVPNSKYDEGCKIMEQFNEIEGIRCVCTRSPESDYANGYSHFALTVDIDEIDNIDFIADGISHIWLNDHFNRSYCDINDVVKCECTLSEKYGYCLIVTATEISKFNLKFMIDKLIENGFVVDGIDYSKHTYVIPFADLFGYNID